MYFTLKSSFILNMDDDKSGIVFLFKPFLLASCYPRGKVPGSDLKVDSEGVCNLILLDTVKLIRSYC